MKTRLVATVALATALFAVLVSVAMGHAALQSSDPADGATIKTPYTLTATFDDELTPNGSSIVVQNSAGTQVAAGTVSTTDDKVQTVDLPALPDGTYIVLWTCVTADDAGLTRGTYQFTVGAVAASAPPTPSPSAAPGSSRGTDSGVLVAVGVAVAISVAVLAFVLYRNRRR